MTPEDVAKVLRAQPFRPFRVHLADGRHYDVPRPQVALVTRRELLVVVGPYWREIVGREFAHCDHDQITKLEILADAEAG